MGLDKSIYFEKNEVRIIDQRWLPHKLVIETLETVDIEEPEPIDITIEYLNYVSCDGYGDGSLTSSIQGGTPPYEFQWVDTPTGNVISTNQDVFDLEAGAYALQVIDDNGCSNQATFIVGNPNPLTVEITTADVSCYGGNDGSIEIFTSGGSAPFIDLYIDSNGDVANPNELSEGEYTVTITDDNGCFIIESFTINQPDST